MAPAESTSPARPADTKEHRRLREAGGNNVSWKKWGPYLSERQWGTVREDYSESGSAWDYFTHDQARSRAYQENAVEGHLCACRGYTE